MSQTVQLWFRQNHCQTLIPWMEPGFRGQSNSGVTCCSGAHGQTSLQALKCTCGQLGRGCKLGRGRRYRLWAVQVLGVRSEHVRFEDHTSSPRLTVLHMLSPFTPVFPAMPMIWASPLDATFWLSPGSLLYSPAHATHVTMKLRLL